ncbi:MAG: DNA polymerase III subunit delta [Actinomycetota bacterium]|nr:DNA polymerase III subunit delta [Actinomycetota bacterium]
MTSPVYLLSGETFLAEEAIDRIRSEAGTDPLSEASFGGDVAAAELLGALDTPSLLGGRRLVVVRDAQDLGKEQVEALTRYLEAPSPSSVLVLVASGRTKLDTAVRSAGSVLALEAPKGRRLVGWIRERGREHKLRVDDRAGWALLDSVGTELRDLDGALSQLSTALGAGAAVGAADVRKAFPRLADERVFAFQDAVGERRLAVAMTALRRLLEQGDEPLMVFGALSSQVRRMLRARRFADLDAKAVGDAMGLPSWRAERLQRQCRSYREEELVEAMTVLAATDVEMKGGDLPPEAALERAVVQIVTGQMSLTR